MIARRAQAHQVMLVAHTTPYDSAFTTSLHRVAATMEHAGASAPEALRRATAILYRQVVGQATTLAYLDVLRVLAVATLLMMPLLLLTRRAKGAAASAH
jgi:DHA2 family multidrug resistance protein